MVDIPLATIEHSLELVSAFIGFSVAYVALRGYRATGSPTMLRLSIAFFLLGVGFFFQGATELITSLSELLFLVSVMVVLGGLFETIGYFFLAFSHAVNVYGRSKAMPVFIFLPMAALRTLSFYFVLYSFVETSVAFFRTRSRGTFSIALGLGLIMISLFIEWLSLTTSITPFTTFLEVVKVVGLLLIFSTVARIHFRRGVG